LLNRLGDSQYYSDIQLFQKQMICMQYGEIPIYTYLRHINNGRRVLPEWVLNGITNDMLTDPIHQLDIEYLVRDSAK
jgi:hypothetical protein